MGLGALGAVVVGGAIAGVGIGGFGWLIGQAGERIVGGSPNRIVARVDVPGVGDVTVRGKHVSHVQLLSGEAGWEVGLPHQKRIVTLHGDDAVRVLGKLLPESNRFGGTKERVAEAVALLERESNPLRFFDVVARQATSRARPQLGALPEATRLALEMAAHEDTERRALEGELALLEQAWKEAEEVAAIADNMFLPSFVEDWMRKHRKG